MILAQRSVIGQIALMIGDGRHKRVSLTFLFFSFRSSSSHSPSSNQQRSPNNFSFLTNKHTSHNVTLDSCRRTASPPSHPLHPGKLVHPFLSCQDRTHMRTTGTRNLIFITTSCSPQTLPLWGCNCGFCIHGSGRSVVALTLFAHCETHGRRIVFLCVHLVIRLTEKSVPTVFFHTSFSWHTNKPRTTTCNTGSTLMPHLTFLRY